MGSFGLPKTKSKIVPTAVSKADEHFKPPKNVKVNQLLIDKMFHNLKSNTRGEFGSLEFSPGELKR